MSRIEESVEINCPVEKAFAFTTDAGNWNQWQSILPEAEQTSQGPVGIGTTFKGTSHLMGRTMPWTARATEYEPNGKFAKNINSGSLIIEQHNTYNPTKGGLRFTIAYNVTVNGFLKLLSPMIVRSMRKELQKSLVNLKQILEA
ncbi:MAG TPA: SRPBCC family protein [Methanoregula sp.]|nr:SRPBCC family protein [Methanoregula sp.]